MKGYCVFSEKVIADRMVDKSPYEYRMSYLHTLYTEWVTLLQSTVVGGNG